VWLLFIGNCCFAPHGIAPTRRTRVDDGLLDVRLVSAEVSWARTRVAGALLLGRLSSSPVFERWLATELDVRSAQGPLQLARDGEIWEGSETFTVRKRAEPLHVFQPTPVGP
jgi:undecaprenyl-diphosphatase